MPAIADMTIKKANGTTDILWSHKQGAAGDQPAIWRSSTVGTAIAHQPELRLTSRDASKGTKRAMRATIVWPQIATDSTTGLTSVVDKAFFGADVTLPKSMPTAELLEFAHQSANLWYHALLKAAVAEGMAPT